MADKKALQEALEQIQPKLPPILESYGLELASTSLGTQGGILTLRFVIDRPKLIEQLNETPNNGSLVTIEDCAVFSRRVSSLLDEIYSEDGPNYNLEVSSPGLDRPLVSERDFRRFDGALVKIKLTIDGRASRYTGRLISKTGPLRLVTKDGEIAFGLDDVVSARLVPEI
ncbi:MAG: ribosome maturation factor RimP [Deltaproteobacteria bacterium]|nr:ribosome maturation factor RimP [Deltaproteobacteria bacterium]